MSAPRSLVSGLVRGAVLWAVPVLLISAITLSWVYRNTIYRTFDEPLEATITSLIAFAETDTDGSLSLTREPTDPRYQRALSGRYWVMGEAAENGAITPALSSRSLYGAAIDLPKSDLAAPVGSIIRSRTSGPDTGETLRVVAQQVLLPGRDTPIIVLSAADSSPAVRSIRNFAIIAFGLLSFLVTGLIFAVFAQVRVGLRPLFALQERIADVREGRAARVEGEYPPEISPLAEELNSLITHNRSVVERAQTHVGNLAHALKTPIAVLQNEANSRATTPSDIVSRQTETMSSQVDHHLRRARAAARGQAIGVRTDVDPLVDGLVRTIPRIYRDKPLDIDRTGLTGLRFRGHPRDLEDMVGNLMDNAAKWTRNRIELSVAQNDVTGEILITIDDNGPGLEPSQYEEALKRGARLDEATPGTGLGLAIVDELSEAYQGELTLSRAEIGGLRAELRLPGARD